MGGEDWDPWEADYGDDLQAMMDMENPEVHDRDSHNEDSTIQNFEITTDDAQPVLPNNDFPNQYAHQQLLHGVARSMFSGRKLFRDLYEATLLLTLYGVLKAKRADRRPWRLAFPD